MRPNEKEANEWREPKQQGLTLAAKLLQIIGGFFNWIWHTVLIFLGVCVLLVISAEGGLLGQLVSLLAAFLIFLTVQPWPAPPSFDKQEPDQNSHET